MAIYSNCKRVCTLTISFVPNFSSFTVGGLSSAVTVSGDVIVSGDIIDSTCDVFKNYTGDIGEVLLYDSALSDTDRGSIERKMAAKWDLLPGSHVAVRITGVKPTREWTGEFFKREQERDVQKTLMREWNNRQVLLVLEG